MFKIFKTLILIIWLIDILNIDFIINNIHIAQFLDITLPINFWFWLLFWLLVPTSQLVTINKDYDYITDKYLRIKRNRKD